MLELNPLVNMTNMAKKTEIPHDSVTWTPRSEANNHHFPGFPGEK